MGDLNAVESSTAIKGLLEEAGLVDAFRAKNPEAPGHTVWQPVLVPERRAFRRVDYVLMAPGRIFPGAVVDSRVVVDAPGYTVWQPVLAPERRAFRRVDYVLMAPGRMFPGAVVDSRVVVDAPGRLPDGSAIWPSDHYGVLADLAVFPPGGSGVTSLRSTGQD